MLCNKIGLITVIALLVIGRSRGKLVFPDVGNSQFSTKLTCVRITECPSILELLKRRPVTPYIIKLIRTSSCGFDGHIEKVWCPKVHNVSTTTTEEPITEEPATETLTTEEPTTEEPTTETIEIFEKLVLPNSTDPIPRKNHFPIDLCNNGIAFKVMGGTSTDIDQYPWMALLQYENSKTKKLYNGCAGALLSHRYVLTAAHCITTRKPPVKVILGEYDTKNETDCVLLPAGEEDCAPPVIESSIEKVHVHPEWLVDHRRPFYHDIAVIRLASSVEFSDFVNPICMPSSKMKKPTSEDLVVAGWGRTNDGKSSTVKQQLVLPAFPNLECSRVHRKDIIESQICAGGVAGKDTCVGDSGGPLMSFDRTSGIWQVLGIVSLSSRGCGLEGVPGIYTYVPKYVDWINSVVTP